MSASLGFSEWRVTIMLHKIQVILSGALFCFGFLGVCVHFGLVWFCQKLD